MFPWEKRSQAKAYSDKKSNLPNIVGHRSKSGSKDRRGETSDYFPQINSNQNSSPNSSPAFVLENLQDQENRSGKKGSSDSKRLQPNTQFHSQKAKKLGSPDYQRNYARILDEQIRARNAQQNHEKAKNLQLEKRMLEEDDFYKHFGRDKFRENYLEKNLGGIIDENGHYDNEELTNRDSNMDNYMIEQQNSPNEIIEMQMNEPELPTNTEFIDSIDNHIRSKSFENKKNSRDDHSRLDKRTQDYLMKLEYQKALEKQILEKRMKEKYEKEIHLLKSKFEEYQDLNINTMIDGSKKGSHKDHKQRYYLNQRPPSNKTLHPAEINDSFEQSRVYNNEQAYTRQSPTRRLVLPQNMQTLNKNHRRSRSYRKPDRSEMYPNEMGQEISEGPLNNTFDVNSKQNVFEYMSLKQEFERMREELRDEISKRNALLLGLQGKLTNSPSYNGEIFENAVYLPETNVQYRTIPSYQPYIQHPFSVNKVMSNSSSNYAFLPFSQDTGSLNYINGQQQLNKVDSTNYTSLMANILGTAKNLEKSQIDQQSKVHADIENIYRELSSLRRQNDSGLFVGQHRLHSDLQNIQQELTFIKQNKNSSNLQPDKIYDYLNSVYQELNSLKKLNNESLGAQQEKVYSDFQKVYQELEDMKNLYNESLNTQQNKAYGEMENLRKELNILKKLNSESINAQQNKAYGDLERIQRELSSLQRLNNELHLESPSISSQQFEGQPRKTVPVISVFDDLEPKASPSKFKVQSDNLPPRAPSIKQLNYQIQKESIIEKRKSETAPKIRRYTKDLVFKHRGFKRRRDVLSWNDAPNGLYPQLKDICNDQAIAETSENNDDDDYDFDPFLVPENRVESPPTQTEESKQHISISTKKVKKTEEKVNKDKQQPSFFGFFKKM